MNENRNIELTRWPFAGAVTVRMDALAAREWDAKVRLIGTQRTMIWFLAVLLCVAIFAVAFLMSRTVNGADFTHGPRLSLNMLAPDAHYWRLGSFIVGVPDFTGTPRWALQELRIENLHGPGDRAQSRWRADVRSLGERTIGDSDYKSNPLGLDLVAHPQGVARGHLVCAADQSQTQEATDDTHHMSNCVPQDQAFNAQSWERLEERGRDLIMLAAKMNVKARVFEVTLPLFLLEKPDDLTTHAWVGTFNAIGRNCVWYPSHIAKSYLVIWADRTWIETYVMANSATVAGDDIREHLTTVDAVEFASNLDLWQGLADELEDDLEASTDKPPTLEELEMGQ